MYRFGQYPLNIPQITVCFFAHLVSTCEVTEPRRFLLGAPVNWCHGRTSKRSFKEPFGLKLFQDRELATSAGFLVTLCKKNENCSVK